MNINERPNRHFEDKINCVSCNTGQMFVKGVFIVSVLRHLIKKRLTIQCDICKAEEGYEVRRGELIGI